MVAMNLCASSCPLIASRQESLGFSGFWQWKVFFEATADPSTHVAKLVKWFSFQMDYVIVRYTGILIGNGQILCQWALTHNIGNFKCQRNFTAQKYWIFSCKSKSDSTCWFKINFYIESMESIYFALCGYVDPYMLSCCVTKRGETKKY